MASRRRAGQGGTPALLPLRPGSPAPPPGCDHFAKNRWGSCWRRGVSGQEPLHGHPAGFRSPQANPTRATGEPAPEGHRTASPLTRVPYPGQNPRLGQGQQDRHRDPWLSGGPWGACCPPRPLSPRPPPRSQHGGGAGTAAVRHLVLSPRGAQLWPPSGLESQNPAYPSRLRFQNSVCPLLPEPLVASRILKVKVTVAQSCLTLCNPMDCSP